MTTHLQTCQVYDQNGRTTEERYVPICPIPIDGNKPVRLFKNDGSIITWTNFDIVHKFPDGKTITWWTSKPTLTSVFRAIAHGTLEAHCFEFHSDGSVIVRNTRYGECFKFGKDVPGEPEKGSLIEPVHHSGQWFFL